MQQVLNTDKEQLFRLMSVSVRATVTVITFTMFVEKSVFK